jgi:hypothetical protein
VPSTGSRVKSSGDEIGKGEAKSPIGCDAEVLAAKKLPRMRRPRRPPSIISLNLNDELARLTGKKLKICGLKLTG